ncbi:hypothetical protein N9361_02365 [Alphaproteobacteria bacterium]|nr:hypothetical protein [Alphaproteobacteria bacterium]MDC3370269.1 hypothetical protein [Alphaproteobacteria bacterium]
MRPIKWAGNLLPARVTDFDAMTKPLLQNTANHARATYSRTTDSRTTHSLAMIKLRLPSRA